MIDNIVEYLGTTKFRFTAIICIILACILLFKTDISENKNIKCSREKIDEILEQIISEKNRDLSEKMWISCKDGLVKGCITGSITGGFMGAVTGGAIFAIANPLLLYVNES